MISADSFRKEYIVEKSNELKNTGKDILEIAIYAFALLEELSKSKLNFVFKGGTSLMLHFPDIKRLSTDIDIVCDSDKSEIEDILSDICSGSVFISWELDERRSYKGIIPKAHYLIKFHSGVFDTEKHILLDILLEKPGYPEIISKKIENSILINTNEPVPTDTLGINALLGDKLTAFAPNTAGIHYKEGKELSIVKQLFDINLLIDYISDISTVSDSFYFSVNNEINYKQTGNLTIEKVFKDIRDTAFLIAYGFLKKLSGENDLGKYDTFNNGMLALNSFLPGNKRLTRNDILLAASRTAYLSSVIESKKFDDFKLYNEKINIGSYKFPNKPDNQLNKLAKLRGGILYYFKNSLDIIK